jgi:hypothetical protein
LANGRIDFDRNPDVIVDRSDEHCIRALSAIGGRALRDVNMGWIREVIEDTIAYISEAITVVPQPWTDGPYPSSEGRGGELVIYMFLERKTVSDRAKNLVRGR